MLAFYLNAAAVASGNDVNQGEPESGSLYVFCTAVLDAVKTIKQAGQFCCGNSCSPVGDTAAH